METEEDVFIDEKHCKHYPSRLTWLVRWLILTSIINCAGRIHSWYNIWKWHLALKKKRKNRQIPSFFLSHPLHLFKVTDFVMAFSFLICWHLNPFLHNKIQLMCTENCIFSYLHYRMLLHYFIFPKFILPKFKTTQIQRWSHTCSVSLNFIHSW